MQLFRMGTGGHLGSKIESDCMTGWAWFAATRCPALGRNTIGEAGDCKEAGIVFAYRMSLRPTHGCSPTT